MYKIVIYVDSRGKELFSDWLIALKDKKAAYRIQSRIDQLRCGNFGDYKPVGNAVWELRIDVGAGYRVYYSIVGKEVVLLLVGGNKKSQQKDIEKAIYCLLDYKRTKI